MARCEDIELLLGAFEDGELEPHEMQEVARHTAACVACDSVLADYRSIAVSVRGSQDIPKLDNFAGAVMARIQRMHLPVPMPELKRHWYDTVSDWFANVILTGGLAAAVAVATALVMTPELSRYLHRPSANAQHMALPTVVASSKPPSVVRPSVANIPPADSNNVTGNDNIASNNDSTQPNSAGGEAAVGQLAQADNNSDTGTVITRFESDSPVAAVWYPDNKTTVVWVPDQQH